jgi:hypothetical protein
MKRSASLSLATYRDASRAARAYAERKLAELAQRPAVVAAQQPASPVAKRFLAALIAVEVVTFAAALSIAFLR